MKKRIIWNDIKGNWLLAVTTWLFMTISAFMFALTCFLFVSLLGSVDALMEKAKTPDFLQMHAGEISETELLRFAQENEQIRDYQTLNFLNLENSSIILDGNSLADSTQDNGVCVQSRNFDYLLDLHNKIIEVSDGEIYVPVCYRKEYDLTVGENVQIGENSFILAGFLRDSQMNSMMASSKRFLVSEGDYEKLKETGSEEYLIEFLLQEGTDCTHIHGAGNDHSRPHHRNDGILQIGQVARDGPHDTAQKLGVGGAACQLIVECIKLADRCGLMIEYFNDLLSVNHLLNVSVHLAVGALLLNKETDRVFGDEAKRNGHHNERHNDNQHQSPRQEQHGEKHPDKGDC